MSGTSRVVVIGGGSGIGLEVARMALADDSEVVLVGRSEQRLQGALRSLDGGRVEMLICDIGERSQVAALFERIGELDHLVVTAADLPYGPVASLSEVELMRAVRSKFLGPVFAAQEASTRIRPGGSITFTSGIAAQRPMRGGATAAAVNSGLEGLARALAIELAPIRVNVISPGWTDTPIWDRISGAAPKNWKQDSFDAMAARLPVGRIGQVGDIAQAFMFVMKNQFVTGSVMDVDGGHRLV
jgi:NAD(P)-dependent dehydrogenase (short-subunit alcohol dehydrogenase family)